MLRLFNKFTLARKQLCAAGCSDCFFELSFYQGDRSRVSQSSSDWIKRGGSGGFMETAHFERCNDCDGGSAKRRG